MQTVFRAIGRLARSHITALINGESGIGKELVARALHRHSPRSDQPFIALNMAAISHDLLESKLFGHERGAFTGAQGRRQGRFEQAHGGTLCLDKIGDMPAELQTRLLRVLADVEFYRIGGTSPVRVGVRIIAATHQNLEQHVQNGLFREDLFHRLNVIRIRLSALRERREDIPLLMRHFLSRAAAELDCEPKVLLSSTEERLGCLEWQGNVRQLENTARWLTVMASSKGIHAEDLPPELWWVGEPGRRRTTRGRSPYAGGPAMDSGRVRQPCWTEHSPYSSRSSSRRPWNTPVTGAKRPRVCWVWAGIPWPARSKRCGSTWIPLRSRMRNSLSRKGAKGAKGAKVFVRRGKRSEPHRPGSIETPEGA